MYVLSFACYMVAAWRPHEPSPRKESA